MPHYEPVESPDHTTIFPYHELTPPTIRDVYRARRVVSQHLPETPLVRSSWLSETLDAEVYLKREDTLPTGAFKVRGGINLVSKLDPAFHDPGLIGASTGNHGQSVAFAGNTFDVPVTICVPADANPEKVVAMERFGAEVIHHGEDFDEAREHAEQLAAEEGFRYVHSANEPALIAGVGTAGLEVIDAQPDVDTMYCPIGGGSSAAGYCLTVGEVLDATIVGVQSAAAPAMYRAWDERTLDPHDMMETFAEGVASRVPFALTMEMLWDRLDDFLLVEDDAIWETMEAIIQEERIVAEGAGATAIAGALAQDDVAGETVVIQISGRNISMQKLQHLLATD